MITAGLAAAMLMLAGGTAAETPAEPQEQSEPAPLKPGQERVKVRCEMEKKNGSRIGKRVCRRLDFAEREEQAAQDLAREMSRQPIVPVDPFRPR